MIKAVAAAECYLFPRWFRNGTFDSEKNNNFALTSTEFCELSLPLLKTVREHVGTLRRTTKSGDERM